MDKTSSWSFWAGRQGKSGSDTAIRRYRHSGGHSLLKNRNADGCNSVQRIIHKHCALHGYRSGRLQIKNGIRHKAGFHYENFVIATVTAKTSTYLQLIYNLSTAYRQACLQGYPQAYPLNLTAYLQAINSLYIAYPPFILGLIPRL